MYTLKCRQYFVSCTALKLKLNLQDSEREAEEKKSKDKNEVESKLSESLDTRVGYLVFIMMMFFPSIGGSAVASYNCREVLMRWFVLVCVPPLLVPLDAINLQK